MVRSTREFTAETVPAGLLSAHQVATDVWGVLRVFAGTVTFVAEEEGFSTVVEAGQTQAIKPDWPHHVEPDADARFIVEFHR